MMEIVDRYIYAVVKRLPEKQREDIGRELRGLIEDMVEQFEDDESYEYKVSKVLLELGDPSILADKYREGGRYLIGPRNFDYYLLVLKIVFGAVLLGVSVAAIVDNFTTNYNVAESITGYLETLFSGILQAFAWVTIAFGLIEYNGKKVNVEKRKNKSWSLSDLPELPIKKAMIKRSEPIVSIIFSTIFIIILWSNPELYAAYLPHKNGLITVIPVFNLEILRQYRAFFIIIFILILLRECLKLIAGKWSLKLSLGVVGVRAAELILTLIIFVNPKVWNSEFPTELVKLLHLNNDFFNTWNNLTNGIIGVIIIVSMIEISKVLYKGLKYRV